jgi:hypothetical protein
MPSWKELKRFCEHDGWELYKDTDHYFFRKDSDADAPRFTKVSKGTGEIKGNLWKVILHKQLKVTTEYFNSMK